MVTLTTGQAAEEAVSSNLEKRGFKVLMRNWRTRWCEIDIIAEKDDVIHFIEVKYRGSQAQGSGFEYIGPNKLRQLRFAADFWVARNKWEGDYQIVAAEVSGLKFERIELTEIY